MAAMPSMAETVKPPNSAGAILSGCPSTEVAMASSSLPESSRPLMAFAATTPPTISAAEEPIPLDTGISVLPKRISSPDSRCPAQAMTARYAL